MLIKTNSCWLQLNNLFLLTSKFWFLLLFFSAYPCIYFIHVMSKAMISSQNYNPGKLLESIGALWKGVYEPELKPSPIRMEGNY